MNSKKHSNFIIGGIIFILLVSMLAVLSVAADEGDTDILPEDAKLGQYIVLQDESEMAAVDAKLGQYITTAATGTEMAAIDVKLGQYIIDDFDYAAAADLKAARWQAMGEFYAANDFLTDNSQVAENNALRWSAVDDYYSRHGLRNAQIIVATVE